jgi:hypothetical protein
VAWRHKRDAGQAINLYRKDKVMVYFQGKEGGEKNQGGKTSTENSQLGAKKATG